jgi:hypothetical protein
MIRFILTLAVVALLGWLAFGQFLAGPSEPPARTTIASILADPADWEGKVVTVAGSVSERTSLLSIGTLTVWL